jgi:hypothetical protein
VGRGAEEPEVHAQALPAGRKGLAADDRQFVITALVPIVDDFVHPGTLAGVAGMEETIHAHLLAHIKEVYDT